MRLTLIFSTILGIALLIGAVSYTSPIGAGASLTADDIGDSDDEDGWPEPVDPQCGDQIGDGDSDPGESAPEDTPGSQQGSFGIQTPVASETWDGDHDIEWDDCYGSVTATPTLAAETDTPAPTASPTASPTPTTTPFLDLIDESDADCDGDIGGSDAVALLRSLSGAGGGVCEGRGDANCDGDVNSADVARILRIMAGLNEAC